MKKINFISVLCVLFFVGSAHAGCDYNAVYLTGPWGKARFSVEVADDDPKRAQGLMNRESLPQFSGMIFIYDNPQMVSFWMKNTLISLDLIYIKKNGLIDSIYRDLEPMSLKKIKSKSKVKAVLEIPGGDSKLYGINNNSFINIDMIEGN